MGRTSRHRSLPLTALAFWSQQPRYAGRALQGIWRDATRRFALPHNNRSRFAPQPDITRPWAQAVIATPGVIEFDRKASSPSAPHRHPGLRFCRDATKRFALAVATNIPPKQTGETVCKIRCSMLGVDHPTIAYATIPSLRTSVCPPLDWRPWRAAGRPSTRRAWERNSTGHPRLRQPRLAATARGACGRVHQGVR